MPIGDYPILEVILRQLKRNGFEHVTMAVNHQADIIRSFFQEGKRWGVRLDYSLESEPLGTIAPLRLIDDLPDNFLLMNGDVLTDLNFEDFMEEHTEAQELFTVAASHRTSLIDYGVLEADKNNFLRAFREKPQTSHLVSMGVYAVNRRAVEYVPQEGPYGFDELMGALLAAGEPVRVKRHNGYWLDIGRPDDYMQAIDDFPGRQHQLMGP
jgi:NDP-sugar pyrophosphorylase family protein